MVREQHPDQGSALLRIYERLQAPPLQEGDLKLGLYRVIVCNHRVTVLASGDDVKPTRAALGSISSIGGIGGIGSSPRLLYC